MRYAFPLDEILDKFYVMFRDHSTELVCTVWKFHMKKASSTILLIKDITTKIWEPTFEQCKRLRDSVQNQSIKLHDVDLYFRHIEKIEMNLHRLHCGIMKCMGIVRREVDWINKAVELMEEYWSIINLSDAAKTIMTLKKKLKLSGDFSLIQTIAEEVMNIFRG